MNCVVPGSAADRAGLVDGTPLLEVNGTSVRGLTHEQVLRLFVFSRSGDVAIVVFAARRRTSTPTLHSAEIAQAGFVSEAGRGAANRRREGRGSADPAVSRLRTISIRANPSTGILGFSLVTVHDGRGVEAMQICGIQAKGPTAKVGLVLGDILVQVRQGMVSLGTECRRGSVKWPLPQRLPCSLAYLAHAHPGERGAYCRCAARCGHRPADGRAGQRRRPGRAGAGRALEYRGAAVNHPHSVPPVCTRRAFRHGGWSECVASCVTACACGREGWHSRVTACACGRGGG